MDNHPNNRFDRPWSHSSFHPKHSMNLRKNQWSERRRLIFFEYHQESISLVQTIGSGKISSFSVLSPLKKPRSGEEETKEGFRLRSPTAVFSLPWLGHGAKKTQFTLVSGGNPTGFHSKMAGIYGCGSWVWSMNHHFWHAPHDLSWTGVADRAAVWW